MASTTAQPEAGDTETSPPEQPPEQQGKQQKKAAQKPTAPHRAGCPANKERQESYELSAPDGARYRMIRCQDCGGQRKITLQEAKHGIDEEHLDE